MKKQVFKKLLALIVTVSLTAPVQLNSSSAIDQYGEPGCQVPEPSPKTSPRNNDSK